MSLSHLCLRHYTSLLQRTLQTMVAYTVFLQGAHPTVVCFFESIPFPFDILMYILWVSITGVFLVFAAFGALFGTFVFISRVVDWARGKQSDISITMLALVFAVMLAGASVGVFISTSRVV